MAHVNTETLENENLLVEGHHGSDTAENEIRNIQ
jgi:hypothetical protein